MERPKWNTAPIRCGRTKCKWRGYEGQLSERKEGPWTRKVCPKCGCDEYMFMTPGEIKAWERKKARSPEAQVEIWNASVEVGDWVEYREVLGEGEASLFRTRSVAQVLSGHTAVVWLEGKSGCVCLEHCSKAAPDQAGAAKEEAA